jgi:hypothetical protein
VNPDYDQAPAAADAAEAADRTASVAEVPANGGPR